MQTNGGPFNPSARTAMLTVQGVFATQRAKDQYGAQGSYYPANLSKTGRNVQNVQNNDILFSVKGDIPVMPGDNGMTPYIQDYSTTQDTTGQTSCPVVLSSLNGFDTPGNGLAQFWRELVALRSDIPAHIADTVFRAAVASHLRIAGVALTESQYVPGSVTQRDMEDMITIQAYGKVSLLCRLENVQAGSMVVAVPPLVSEIRRGSNSPQAVVDGKAQLLIRQLTRVGIATQLTSIAFVFLKHFEAFRAAMDMQDVAQYFAAPNALYQSNVVGGAELISKLLRDGYLHEITAAIPDAGLGNNATRALFRECITVPGGAAIRPEFDELAPILAAYLGAIRPAMPGLRNARPFDAHVSRQLANPEKERLWKDFAMEFIQNTFHDSVSLDARLRTAHGAAQLRAGNMAQYNAYVPIPESSNFTYNNSLAGNYAKLKLEQPRAVFLGVAGAMARIFENVIGIAVSDGVNNNQVSSGAEVFLSPQAFI